MAFSDIFHARVYQEKQEKMEAKMEEQRQLLCNARRNMPQAIMSYGHPGIVGSFEHSINIDNNDRVTTNQKLLLIEEGL